MNFKLLPLVTALSFSLTGCGGGGGSDSAPSNNYDGKVDNSTCQNLYGHTTAKNQFYFCQTEPNSDDPNRIVQFSSESASSCETNRKESIEQSLPVTSQCFSGLADSGWSDWEYAVESSLGGFAATAPNGETIQVLEDGSNQHLFSTVTSYGTNTTNFYGVVFNNNYYDVSGYSSNSGYGVAKECSLTWSKRELKEYGNVIETEYRVGCDDDSTDSHLVFKKAEPLSKTITNMNYVSGHLISKYNDMKKEYVNNYSSSLSLVMNTSGEFVSNVRLYDNDYNYNFYNMHTTFKNDGKASITLSDYRGATNFYNGAYTTLFNGSNLLTLMFNIDSDGSLEWGSFMLSNNKGINRTENKKLF
ncbi:hypothetical protein KEC58_03405 [Photobacterium damselae]|uniref:hypothetical protein n=1 Tax=Photobacterium damselae TaxID=38293 RepID=UPI002543AF38